MLTRQPTCNNRLMQRRRTLVPAESQSPLLFLGGEADSRERRKPESLLVNGDSRADGRSWNEMRPVSIQSGVVCNATGSAYIEMGGTKIIGSVYGPRELSRGEDFTMEGIINCELKFAPFSTKFRKHPRQEQEERFFSNLIGQAIKGFISMYGGVAGCGAQEAFPKLQVEVSITVLEDCGSVFAGAVLCAVVAMVTGGIEMKDIPTACKVSYGGDHFLCDPTSQEEYTPTDPAHVTPTSTLTGDITVIYSPSLQEVTGVCHRGLMDMKMSGKALEVCIVGCAQLRERVRTFLEQYEKNQTEG